jgi:signal peptidase I
LFLEPKRNLVVQTSTEIHQGVEISRKGKEPVVVEYSKSFFPVLLIVFLLRGFIVEPFRIPSGSMLPSLYIGDFILVNKFAYGIKLPVLNTKIIDLSSPERGDIVVFRYPRDPNLDYIKRVIGLPGDHIAYYNKVLYVNGKPVERDFVGQYKGPGQTFANEYLEKLQGAEHSILLLPARPNNLQGEYIVPEGMYFVMGDNRDNSNDSRVWGPVPEQNLLGKAFMIWMHFSDELHLDRIGNVIK